MQIYEFDKGTFEIIETGEGFLKGKVTVAVPGVFPYVHGDVITYEAKLPSDILSEKTLDSIRGAPATNEHPEDFDGNHIFVDSSNYKRFAKGNFSEPQVIDNEIVAFETIYDSDLIAQIKAGKKQVSIGFRCVKEKVNGIFNRIRYDTRQKDIVINHIAHTSFGRAGDRAKIHIDRGDIMNNHVKNAAGEENTPDVNQKYSYRMFDSSKDISVSSELHTELMKLQKKIKEQNKTIEVDSSMLTKLEDKIKTIENDSVPNGDVEILKGKLSLLEDEKEAWIKKYDSLEKTIPEKVNSASIERINLVSIAKSAIPELACDSMSNRDIMIQVISKGLPYKPGVAIDSLTDDAIDARFDASMELLKEKSTMTQPGAVMSFDKNDIDKKRLALTQVYNKEQEKGGI